MTPLSRAVVRTVLLGLIFGLSKPAAAQTLGATILRGSEIDAVRAGTTGDVQMVVSNAGAYQIGLATIKRNSTGRPERPIVHSKITEIYIITAGSGTLALGGIVEGAEAVPADNDIVRKLAGPTTMGGTLSAAEDCPVTKGDVIVIPPGVQHSFSSIAGAIEYLMVRVDAEKVLPAGLIHDIVRSLRTR
jgi:hypothetical protein